MLELDSHFVGEIVKAVKAGEWPREAAVRMGATRAEFAVWWHAGEEASTGKAAGREPETPHVELCCELVERCHQAEAEHEYQCLMLMTRFAADPKARGAWTGQMTILERRHSDRWRKREMSKKTREEVVDYDAAMRELSKGKGSDAAEDRRRLGGRD